MTGVSRHDAVVLGAGMAGNATAIALAMQGLDVAIVEKAPFPRRKVCGEFLSATSVPVLDALGIGAAWRDRAGPEIRRVDLYAGRRIVGAPMPRADGVAHGRALGRDVIDTLMLARAADLGARVHQPWKAVALTPVAGGTEVAIVGAAGEMRLRAPIVVAAHGSWERGPLPTTLPKRHGPADLMGFKAYFRDATLAPDVMPLLAFPGGYGGMVWADRGRLSISCCIRRDRLDALRAARGGTAAEALQAHLLDTTAGVRRAIGHARLDGRWLATGPIRPGIRVPARDDVFRVGNVAGESHPIIAEGQSMAIQSAWLLAGILRGVDIHDPAARREAAATYARAWRRHFATRIRAAAAFSWLAMRPGVSDLAGALVERVPGILAAGARLSGKTRGAVGPDLRQSQAPTR